MGKQTIGIYPLLEDNSTYILATDFDKDDWLESVQAYAKACNYLNIPHIIERSRSGNGGHVWIFFSESVSASDARKLGSGLLNKAMEMYPALSFSCFDRLFPSQDILPKGGLGNLIALPLQLEPRKQGNSLFIDDNGKPFKDQWAKLASIKRVTKNELAQHLNALEALKEQLNEGISNSPWKNLNRIEHEKIANCPKQLKLILANQLYIPLGQLPGKLTSKLKQLAVFSNPEFYKRQALRLTTIGVSRYICAAHIEGDYLILPRGCLSDAESLLTEQDINLNYDDKRYEGKTLPKIKFKGKLKSQQSKAVKALLESNFGILQASTGFGKTVVALALISKRKINTLILVHSRQLAEQWIERINVFLSSVKIGSLLGGKDKLTYEVDVATYQSLVNRNGLDIKSNIEQYGQILVDECHHLSASNYESLIKSCHSKYIHGFTATPKRQDGLEKLMMFQLGNILYKGVKLNVQLKQQVNVTQTTTDFPDEWLEKESKPHISQVYKHLVQCAKRNKLIADEIQSAYKNNRAIMVLTERKEHIETLALLLSERNLPFTELHGGISAKQRQERIALLEANKNQSDKHIILATGKYVGEGFDLPYLDCLFITLPIAWKGVLAQYAGRIQREWSKKDSIQVFDYLDNFPTLKRMFAKREKGYKALGYKINVK